MHLGEVTQHCGIACVGCVRDQARDVPEDAGTAQAVEVNLMVKNLFDLAATRRASPQ